MQQVLSEVYFNFVQTHGMEVKFKHSGKKKKKKENFNFFFFFKGRSGLKPAIGEREDVCQGLRSVEKLL